MPHVDVKLSRDPYRIHIASGLLSRCDRILGPLLPKASRAVVLSDRNVAAACAGPVVRALRRLRREVELIVLPPGETRKSLQVAEHLYESLLEFRMDRRSALVAVGGGVIGDLGGFVAATYLRGIPFVQVPTTLLAQVDASVGGKVAVNLPQGKNLVGVFHQPRTVLIDPGVLRTLPPREFAAGLAEVIKYGVIRDADLFAFLETHLDRIRSREPAALERILVRSVAIKARVVEKDERELSGAREILNYGHTVGHAIEALTGYRKYLHGEAVAIGMDRAARLAERLGRLAPAAVSRQRDLLRRAGLPVEMPKLRAADLIAAVLRDKKTRDGKARFVLPERIGKATVGHEVSESQLREILND